jgi:outer membrane receptor protein involved in Fe transport
MATSCLVAVAATPSWGQTAETVPSVTGDPVADAKLIAERDRTGPPSADEIIVTGTRIVRPNMKSAAPIVTVTAAEIAAQGATTIEEVLNRLPQVQPNAEQNYADSNGLQRVKLRSLGYERTLTLIDGMRLGIGNASSDVGIVPNALVERIDVLSGGASSVYGSDAVSGVVNFILKKNFDGIRLDANYSFYNHNNKPNAVTDAATRSFFPSASGMTNDGGRSNVTLSLGKNLFGGAVNLTGFANYRQSNLLRLADRSYAACEAVQSVRDGPLSCSAATFTGAGTIIPQSGPNRGRVLVNNPDGSRTLVPINSRPGTAANPFDGFSFQREFERINTGGFLNVRVSSDIELYSSALFYRDKSRNPQLNRTLNFGAYGLAPYSLPCNNPFLSAAQAQTICGAAAGTATVAPIDLRYRFDGTQPVYDRFVNKGMRIQGGLRGRVLDNVWNYDVAFVYAKSKQSAFGRANPDYARVNRALDVTLVGGVPTCRSVVNGTDPACVPFNAFIPGNSDTAFNEYLFGPGEFNFSNTRFTTLPRLWQVLTTLSGDLGKYGITSPFANQGVAVAVGSEFRAERQANSANAAYRAAFGGTNGVPLTQNVWEVNAELQAPLVEDKSWTQLLQVNAGYRLSEYNRLSGRFNTWKLEALWSPIDDITFRGAYNKAQRAPTITQASSAVDINYANTNSPNDPCASTPNPNNPDALLPPTATIEQCRATGLPDNLYGSQTLNCPDQSCTIRNGGFGLTPETAYTTTFGVVVRPRFLPGLSLSVDRVIVNLRDSINFFSAASFLNGCLEFRIDYYCRGVVRNPGTFTLSSPTTGDPAAGFLAQGLSNGFKSKFHSWDFQGQYGLGLGSAGRLSFDFNGSLATLVGGQDSPDVASRNCSGYYGRLCGESLPRWSHSLRTTWTTVDGNFNTSVNWRHTAPTTLDTNVTDPDLGIPIDPNQFRNTFAGIAAYDYIDLSMNVSIAKQFSLRVGVNNVFDTAPPIVPNSRAVLGLLRANTVFRYDLLGRQITLGASVNF